MRTANTRKIAILGSGIVSNLATKLLKDTIVLTKKRTPIFLDNVFIHDTIENRLMLMLFGIDFKSHEIPVWYYNYKTGVADTICNREISNQIAREKMGDLTKEYISKLTYQAEALSIFPYKVVEYPDFVRLFFNDLEYVDFEYLINTIPQPFFDPLLNPNYQKQFVYRPLIFITAPCIAPDSMTYSYNNCPWKRQFVKNYILCIEFNKEDFSLDILFKEFPELKHVEYKLIEIPYGRIKSQEVKDTPRIKHIGRFAQWNHSITTEHSINKLINLNL